MPSGDQSDNSANVPGRSGFQRALLSVSSAQKCSGAGRLATLRGVPRAARSAVPCRSSVPGHRASRSKYTRDQSRETGSLSRLFGSVVLPNVSQWVTHTVEQAMWRSASSLSTGEQALVMEQEVSTLLREETIEVVPALDKESGFYSRTSLFRGKGLRPS